MFARWPVVGSMELATFIEQAPVHAHGDIVAPRASAWCSSFAATPTAPLSSLESSDVSLNYDPVTHYIIKTLHLATCYVVVQFMHLRM